MWFTSWTHNWLDLRNYMGVRSKRWGTGKKDKTTLCLQHLVGERKYFLLRKARQSFVAKTQFFQYQKGYTTCNLLPLDRNVCLSSSARSWPSFCQVILGEGLPLGMQSMAASLLTSTVTSSGRSPSAPLMDGGAAGSKGQKNTHSAPLKWLWDETGFAGGRSETSSEW